MSAFRPKYITFDCYGTLTNFQMSSMARKLFPGRVAPDQMEEFVDDFRGYRLDEVLGAWKPYCEVVRNALERSCRLWAVPFREADAEAIYAAIPS